MELEEAKEIMDLFVKNIAVEGVKVFELKDACKTVLQEIEHLQKKQKELMNEYHKRVQERIDIEQELKDSISKDKIREKIEEINDKRGEVNGWESEFDYAVEILQDLLKEE